MGKLFGTNFYKTRQQIKQFITQINSNLESPFIRQSHAIHFPD